MIELQRLMIKNFKSFGSKPQIVQLNKLGLSLLVGQNKDEFKSNGAGKSSFLEAIVYALFGATSDGSKGDSLVNRKVGKNMEIILSFKKDNDEYTIVRFRKDEKHKNKTFLLHGEKNITQRSIKATNKYIVNLLGIDRETYLHSYAFGLNSDVSFASMTDREKKRVLDDMAHLSIYPVARQVAKDDADDISAKINNINSKIDAIKYSKQSLEKLQNEQYKSDKKWHNHYVQIKHKLITLKHKCLSLGQTQNSHSLSYYKAEIKKLHNKVYKNYLPKIKSYKKLENQVGLDKQAINAISNHMSVYNDKKQELVSANKDLLNKLKKIMSGNQKKCYWCGQVLNSVHKKHLQIQLAKNYKNNQNKIKDYINLQQKLFKNINVVKIKASKDKKQVPDVSLEESNITKSNKLISNAQGHINDIKEQLNELKEVAKEYKRISTEAAPDYTNRLKEVTNKLVKVSHVMKKYQLKLKLYQQSEDIYSNHGVKSMVLDLVLPFINKQANHYLQLLTSGDISIFIKPTTTSKSTGHTSQRINLQVTNLHGADDYNGLSSGEKKRVDLSIVLSLQDYVLSQVSSKMNFCAYDELFAHLDNSTNEGVMKILINRLKVTPNIIVVTHQPELMDKFEKQLIITKKNGVSTVSSK